MSLRETDSLWKLIADIADYRIMSLSQIAYLHFSGKRSARRRMQQLEKDGLVVVLQGPTARRGGRPEKIFGLSKKGCEMLGSSLKKRCYLALEHVSGEKLGHQTGHQLLLNWVRVHLTYVTREIPRVEHRIISSNSPLALDEETGWSVVSDTLIGPEEESAVRFTPDAVFILTDTEQSKSVLFFLEVDMGTEPLANGKGNDIQEKICRYQEYFRSGQYKKYERTWNTSLNGFRLLFVANSQARFESVASVIRNTPPSDFVWATFEERMFNDGISDTIWSKGGQTQRRPESILDGLACPMPLPELTE